MRVPVVLAAMIAVAAVSTAALVGSAAPAGAVTSQDRLAVLTAWTQPTRASAAAWDAARGDRAAWAAYDFDWSTDYCTDSPDAPAGFDFTLACARHDFGHRNFAALNIFAANKTRVDDAFYADMRAVCARYSTIRRDICDGFALTYYEAAKVFGLIPSTATRS